MHKGRPFEIEQRLRPFAANDLYSTGWPAKTYSMSVGTYTGSSSSFVSIPTPDLTLQSMDADGLGGDYWGVIADPIMADLKVGFHFRFNPSINQTEAWVQCYFNGQRSLYEPSSGDNHLGYAWNPVSLFPLDPGGPFHNNIRPTHVIWDPKGY